jgi:hypothetical protein
MMISGALCFAVEFVDDVRGMWERRRKKVKLLRATF